MRIRVNRIFAKNLTFKLQNLQRLKYKNFKFKIKSFNF